MTAEELIRDLSWSIWTLIFVIVAARAVRRPLRTNVDVALLFGAAALIIGSSVALELGLLVQSRLSSAITVALLLAIPYLFLRLLDDFSEVPWLLMRASEAVLALLVAGTFAFDPAPVWLTIGLLAYLIGLPVYATVAFQRESRRARGVTRRRLRCVAAGSALLGLLFVIASMRLVLPTLSALWTILSDLAGLAAGISYFLGFAPPGLLRRAWQEPELRAFLAQAARLPRLPTTESIVHELEQGAATSVGARNAAVGLWDEQAQSLHFSRAGESLDVRPTMEIPVGRAFLAQVPVFSPDVQREAPNYAPVSQAYGAKALLAAPITAGEKRLGVLVVFAPRAPIFADDDLELVKLLADQAAVILESRALIDEATRVRAREEAARLKDDFLSAAAHDLKTPLTTLMAQAQLLERRAQRMPDAPADVPAIQRIVKESERLRDLVLELLDAARAEQGKLVGTREPVDLGEIAREGCERHFSARHPCVLDTNGPVVGMYDRGRIAQLLENLLENAVKYSPDGGEIRVRVWPEGDAAHLTVADQGIGIPPEDLPRIFDRFHRGKNVDDRRFAGMGLGLFICRGIAEQHGGQISASSTPGRGTTFHVALPLAANGGPHDGSAPDSDCG
ncbi:MAG TPA: ATP-binding protein [Ardenticatenaceae bacterium]|nr:ATP-binding protein [Ardenticatenaceae bacterium]